MFMKELSTFCEGIENTSSDNTLLKNKNNTKQTIEINSCVDIILYVNGNKSINNSTYKLEDTPILCSYEGD